MMASEARSHVPESGTVCKDVQGCPNRKEAERDGVASRNSKCSMRTCSLGSSAAPSENCLLAPVCAAAAAVTDAPTGAATAACSTTSPCLSCQAPEPGLGSPLQNDLDTHATTSALHTKAIHIAHTSKADPEAGNVCEPAGHRRPAWPAPPHAPRPARRRTAPANRLCGPQPRPAGRRRLHHQAARDRRMFGACLRCTRGVLPML